MVYTIIEGWIRNWQEMPSLEDGWQQTVLSLQGEPEEWDDYTDFPNHQGSENLKCSRNKGTRKCTPWVKIGYATKVEELMQERESWRIVVWKLFIPLETKTLMWLVLANKVLPVGKWDIGADKVDVSYANAMLSLWITCSSSAPSPDLYELTCHRLQGTDQDDIYRHSLVDCLGLHWWQNCSKFSGSHVLLICDIWMSRNFMMFLE